ncbi:MAG: hypothetical protein ACO1RT_04990 [Planctomycetaceae bacterium]
MASPARALDKKNDQAAQQKRIGLIVVLGITFVGVLYVQFFSGDAEPDVIPSASVPSGPVATAVATEPSSPTWTPKLDRDYASLTLKARKLDQIIERHALATAKPPAVEVAPLVVTEPVPVIVAPPVAEPEPVPEPDPLLVRAIYATPKSSAALVGETIVHSGDELPNGKKLVAASPMGITTVANSPASAADSP